MEINKQESELVTKNDRKIIAFGIAIFMASMTAIGVRVVMEWIVSGLGF